MNTGAYLFRRVIAAVLVAIALAALRHWWRA